jgi:hypothetical protein
MWAVIPAAALITGFMSFGFVFFTSDFKKPLNWLMMPAVFFVWISMFLGVSEALTGIAVLIKTGRTSSCPTGFVVGRSVYKAALVRLLLGITIAIVFFTMR